MHVFTATHKCVARTGQCSASLLADLSCPPRSFPERGAATTSGARWISTRAASLWPWAAASVRRRGPGGLTAVSTGINILQSANGLVAAVHRRQAARAQRLGGRRRAQGRAQGRTLVSGTEPLSCCTARSPWAGNGLLSAGDVAAAGVVGGLLAQRRLPRECRRGRNHPRVERGDQAVCGQVRPGWGRSPSLARRVANPEDGSSSRSMSRAGQAQAQGARDRPGVAPDRHRPRVRGPQRVCQCVGRRGPGGRAGQGAGAAGGPGPGASGNGRVAGGLRRGGRAAGRACNGRAAAGGARQRQRQRRALASPVRTSSGA